jgi:hypothetical protein
MTLNAWAAVATIVQAVFVPISLLLVWFQLWRQSHLTKAANMQALVDLSSPFNLQLIQDREFAKLWVQGASTFRTMDDVDQYRFTSLIIWWLMLHENVFYQHKKKLIDDPTFEAWRRDLAQFVVKMNLAEHWPDIGAVYQRDFAEYVDDLVKSSK